MAHLSFIAVLIAILLLSSYIFRRLYRLLPTMPIWARVIYILLAIIIIIAWPLTLFMERSFPIVVDRYLYLIGSSWVIILIYFVFAFLGIDLLRLTNRCFKWMNPESAKRLTDHNGWLFLLIVGVISGSMILGNIHYHHKGVLKGDIAVQSSALDGMVIIGLSDLHFGYTIDAAEFSTWVDLINAENPDLVLLAGDIIDSSIRPLLAEEATYRALFSKIEAPIYGVLGNHEYIGDLDANIAFLKSMGIILLRDEAVDLDDTITIIGRDDRTNHQRKSLSTLMEGVNRDHFIIVLDHQPYNLGESIAEKVDLHFSGHSHEGQIWPYSWVTKLIYKLDYGVRKVDNTTLAVSSGIGIWGGKFRIGTQSEYLRLQLINDI